MKPYYQDSFATIYHGDNRDFIGNLAKADLILTDPPYGIGEAAGKNKSRDNLAVAKDYGNLTWDNHRVTQATLNEIISEMAERAIVFGGNYYDMPGSSCWLIWDKENGESDFADCEIAWTNLPGAIRLIRWQWNGMLKKIKEHREHPTQKPVYVMQWCILQADKKLKTAPQTVIDPFMGSGTTLVAAKNLNRKSIGIEIEEKYCEIAAKRLSQEVLNFTGAA